MDIKIYSINQSMMNIIMVSHSPFDSFFHGIHYLVKDTHHIKTNVNTDKTCSASFKARLTMQEARLHKPLQNVLMY